MYSQLVSGGRATYLIGLVLALVLVVPVVWFPFQLTKVTAFALCALLAAVLFVFGGGMRELVRSHGFYAALLIGLLPLSYLLSLQFSIDPSVGLLGYSMEADTVIFATLCMAAFLLSFAYFRTLRTARLLLSVLSGTLGVVVLFQIISITFGMPFEAFTDASVNLVGKWNDLGLLIGLLALLLLVRVELMSTTLGFRIGAAIVALVLVLLLGIINFPVVWGMLLVFALAIGIVKFITQKGAPREEGSPQELWRLPWFSAAAIIAAIALLFFGTAFNAGLTSIFPVSSLEVRPSYESTMNIHAATREGSAGRLLWGTGPNTFGQAWLLHKPQEVNQSLFWNVDFNVGFSILLTALGTVGVLGVIAWLVPPLLVLGATARAMRRSILSKEDRGMATALIVGSFFLFGALALYVPSQSVVLLALTLWGATFGFLWRQGQESIEPPRQTRLSALTVGGFALVLIVFMLVVSGVTVRRFISEIFVNVGTVALQEGDADGAFAEAARAAGIETTGNVLRLAASAGATKLAQIATDTSLPQEQAQTSFEEMLGKTLAAGNQAALLNPGDYRPHLILANVYDYLSTLGVEGAYESALASYAQAGERNPQNPSIPLSLARLEGIRGNVDGARTNVTQALTLKQNYTDAILFVVQLDVALNDIPSAIRAAEAAAQTAPGVAPIWFQLGLLYYTAADSARAVGAFERAVALVPEYANAKYFLGLSYYAQNRTEDAIRQFEDLSTTNPDNAEVALILSNLKFGNPPFEGALPPVTPEPENRPSAPIEE